MIFFKTTNQVRRNFKITIISYIFNGYLSFLSRGTRFRQPNNYTLVFKGYFGTG